MAVHRLRSAGGPRAGRTLIGVAVLVGLLGALGCATPGPAPQSSRPSRSDQTPIRPNTVAQPVSAGRLAARTALSMVGTPYRYGGATPRGFDCSGLVVYSYREAGVDNLPRSAQNLEQASRPVTLDRLQPGDLLFFRLSGKKTSHVGLYVGDRSFVHAPSSGKRVERVSFDHVYWGPQIRLAGRL